MLVNIGPIKSRPGASVSAEFTADTIPGLASVGQVKLVAPVAVKAKVTNTGSFYVAKGTLETAIELECSRCLRLYKQQLNLPIDEDYLADEHHVEANGEENDDLFARHNVFSGDVIDLTHAVRELIAVAVPIKCLCREDCPGLCAVCGADKAVGKCQCKNEDVDPRLAPLAVSLQQSHEKKQK